METMILVNSVLFSICSVKAMLYSFELIQNKDERKMDRIDFVIMLIALPMMLSLLFWIKLADLFEYFMPPKIDKE